MGGRKRDRHTENVQQYNSKYLGSADLGIQGTYKYDPGHYHVYTTDNSAETGSSHSNKPSDENSFEETISYGNTRWSRRKVLVVAVIICLLGVVVLGAIAGIVIAVVENNNESSDNQPSALGGSTTASDQSTYSQTTSTPSAVPIIIATTTPQTTETETTSLEQTSTLSLPRTTVLKSSQQTESRSTSMDVTPTTTSPPAAAFTTSSLSTVKSSLASTTDMLTTTQNVETQVSTAKMSTTTRTLTTSSTETVTRKFCELQVAGRFYIWIPVADESDTVLIFNEVEGLLSENGAICFVENLGLIQNSAAKRKKRNTENLYLVIGVAFTSESLSQTDVLTVLYNAVLTGIDKSAIRVESVAGDCVLLGTTGSVSESMCRDLGFMYSYLYDYELIEGIEWKPLPEFQAEHMNISCDPTSRDFAFCAEYYPDCTDEKQLCPEICIDVQRNCPSAYEDLGLSEGYCETLPLFDDCLGNNKTVACDKETEFECPQSGTCISLASLCDGNVDCPLSEFDENESLCVTTPSTTTTSTISITKATSLATPAPNDCAGDEFPCFSDGLCIPDNWYCDNYQDCSDNSDEVDCDCPEGKFRCRLSIPTVCVDEDLLCNNVADCKDSSDEGDCASRTVECKEDEFLCIKFPECVNNSRKCDGTFDCQDKSDEWYGCPIQRTEPLTTEFEVRLMQNSTDTTAQLFGRVEIRERGTPDDYGTICDDMWTKQDALVICRMLNTSFEGEAYPYINSAFGVGSGHFAMTNVDCLGNETNIGLCKSKRTNIHCGDQQQAGVSCGKHFDIPSPASQEKVTVRLKNGDTCLEGLVQVYIEEEWRFVCDDNFDERDATVVCRMLGYESGPAAVRDVFGIGDGVFWLDEVNCRGNETDISQCAFNEPGVHDCLYFEAVGIVCGGIPEMDCNPEPSCIISASCTFDYENCCVDFVTPLPGQGSTRWIWHKAEMIGYPDHTTDSLEGGIIYYRNTFGNEGDQASVKINTLLHSNSSVSMETDLSIQFHYLVQRPHPGALSLMFVNVDGSGMGTELWTLPYTPQELEGVWHYQCVDIGPIPSDMDLVFETVWGHEQNEMVALDDMSVKNEKCQNGIAYQPCSFDVLSLCKVEIDCDHCQQNGMVYRWRILSNWSSQIDEPYVERNGMKGNFMLADASYGLQNDKAVMTFTVSKDASQHAVQFDYLIIEDSSLLQISIATEGNSKYVWRSRGAMGQKLQVGCVMLPEFSNEVILIFEAVKGSSLFGDIAVDNMGVIKECQGLQSCLSGQENCNFTEESSNEDIYTWTKVEQESDGQTQSIFKIEDNQSPFGSWTKLSSPEFAIKNGQYQLHFSLLKQGTGTLNIFITDGLTRQNILAEYFHYADDYEKHCSTMTVGDMNGATLVFESSKGTLGFYEDILNNTEVVYMKDIDLKPGSCNGSLAVKACSFEDNLCEFKVESSSGNLPCNPVYEWTRTGGSFDYKFLKSDRDHSLGNEKGHYMSVVKTPNLDNETSTIHFQEVEIQDIHTTLSLFCYFRMFDTPSDNSELYINVPGLQYDVMNRLLPVDVWQPVCIDLTNLQVASIEISITAKSISVDLDDVELKTGPCAVSIDCSFNNRNNCGYILENGWVHKGTYLEVSTVNSRLISPILNTERDSCVTFRLHSKTNSSSSYSVSGSVQVLDKQTLEKILYEESFKVYLSGSNITLIQFQFSTVLDGVLALSFTQIVTDELITLDEIIFTNSTCPVLECDQSEHTCDNSYCLPAENVCDGMEDCFDKSDEMNCDTCKWCHFTVLGECLCTHNSINVIQVIEDDQPDRKFQFSSQNLFSLVETPVLNLTSFACLKMNGMYVDIEANLRTVRNDSGLLTSLDAFEYEGEATDNVSFSLTLEPGIYSVIVEVIVLHPNAKGIAFTMEELQILDDVCEIDNAEPTTVSTLAVSTGKTTTSTTIQDNTETTSASTATVSQEHTTTIKGEMDILQAYLFTDITLECILNETFNMEKMTLFWYKEGRQLTRNDDIIQQSYVDTPSSINTPKYAVHMENTTFLLYNLIVRKATEEDSGLHECRLDSPSYGLSVERSVVVEVITNSKEKAGNGCYRNSLEICYQHGFGMVSHRGPFERGQDNQGLIFALNIFHDDPIIKEGCKSALESLMCGLFTPKCVNGSNLNICREYCLEIVSVCLEADSDIYQLLRYGCAFLEDYVADSDCYSEWMGCQVTHTSTSGVIWSENFPASYTETNCTTYLQADRYHSLLLNVVDFDIGLGNSIDPCYFEIYDEHQEVLVLRRECGETLDDNSVAVTGGLARITLVTDSESEGRGYRITYEQALRYGCTLINVDDNRLHLTSDTLQSHLESANKQCSSVLLYTEDQKDFIKLEVSDVSNGCISLSTINKNASVDLFKTVCDVVNTMDFEIVGQVLLEIGEGVDDFSIFVQRKKYVRQPDTVTLDEYGRLLVTSEGNVGQACIILDQPSADILCKSLNLGWPADITEAPSDMDSLPTIVSEISCHGTESQITECQFNFNTHGTCSDDDYNVVKCRDVSLSCLFHEETCGYVMNGDIVFQKKDGLVLQKPSYFNALSVSAEITSPTFQYSDGSYVHLEYSIDWGVEDTIIVELVDMSTNDALILWEREIYKVSGYLPGCFRLPDNKDTAGIYRLSVRMLSYRPGAGLASVKTAIRKLTVSPVPCQDTSPTVAICTFENIETCASMLDLDGIACSQEQQSPAQVHILPRGSLYRDAIWLREDHAQYLGYDNFLLIDEGMHVTVLKNITADVLRFRYGIYTAPERDFYLTWRLVANGHAIKTFHSERTNWKSFCFDVKDYMFSSLRLEVGNQALGYNGMMSYASMAIDDIQLSNNPCPDPVSCGFEDSCVQHYTSKNSTMGWNKVYSGTHGYQAYDVTHRTPGIGSFMVVDIQDAGEGFKSILEIENVGRNLQCVSFYLFVGENSSAAFELVINSRNHIPIIQTLSEVWLLHNVELSDVLESVQFVATRGITHDVIALDEVVFTERPCKDLLDRSNLCTFDSTTLCRVETPFSQNSKFKPMRLGQAAESETLSKIKFDADGNFNGTFMHLEGSPTLDKTAAIEFTVNTSRTAYRFWYFILNGVSNTVNQIRLFTAVDDDDDDEDDDNKELLSTTITNAWVMSPCYHLSSPFSGTIEIHAEIDAGEKRVLAIDNLQLVDKENCTDYSLECNFEMDRSCGYISEGQTWTRTNDSWFTTQAGNLSSPVTLLQNSSYCFEFVYEIYDTQTIDGQSKLTLFNNQTEVWYHYGKLKMGNEELLSSRINIQGGLTQLKFVSEGLGIFKILRIALTEGACQPLLDCDPVDEFQCQEKCIDRQMLCDRVIDCFKGEDEAHTSCDFETKTNFNNISTLEESGFVVGSQSSVNWMLSASEILTVNNKSIKITEQTLVTTFNMLTVTPSSLVSRQYFISMETSCLYLSYYGNVTRFTLSLLYKDQTKDMDYNVNLVQSLSRTHLAVPIQKGIVQFQLSVFMVSVDPYYRGMVPTHAKFGLFSFELHEGVKCSDLPISCPPDVPYLCKNKMSCYTDDQKCNLKLDCMDGSDETDDCGYGIPCDFEQPNMCGYQNLTEPKTYWDDRDVYQTPQTLWQRTYTSIITRPNFDHTFGETGKGHFMTSKHYEGLQDEIRYVDTEIIQSPYQTFTNNGCITFWYYLNSTAHQPKTGTAQLFVYLQYGDDGLKELLWYDHVNRPFTDWIQGGISVNGSRNVSLVLKAVTFIPFDSWTGVVSIDDIDYHEGNCTVQRPECDDSMYRCDDNICIPHEFVCDGEPDCHHGNDELNCEERPNGGLQLVGGDGSYGQLGYYHSGQWRPVCYPEDPLEERLFTLNVAQKVCRTLGFRGNYDTFPYRFWSKHSDTSIELTCNSDGDCTAATTMEDCGFFAYVRCTDEVCFSGEVLCPGTQSTCKPRHYFCDGETDCPGNVDELNCFCFEDEYQCLHIEGECGNRTCYTCDDRDMFECKNQQCIPRSERCDGVTQCMDGTDEYRCVQIDEAGLVSVYHRETLQRKPVCVEDINLNIAHVLCELSGKGYVREILRSDTSIVGGVSVSVPENSLNVDTASVFGDCYPLKLRCKMSECGTTSIQDSLVQTYVINGRDASIEEWPWYAVLLGNGFLYCGATLVSPEWLVTATHCIYSGVEYSIVVGVDKWGTRGGSTQIVPVSRIYNYGYDSSGAYPLRDLTLLKLSQPVQINNYTRPICFPTQSTAEYIRQQGTKAECYIVGFGATEKIFDDPSSFDYTPDILQKKRVRIVSYDLCEREWRSGFPSDDPFPKNVYCFATEGPSSPSCFGDSGGPVTCKNERGRWELMGTISFGFGNCLHDIVPTVATSVLQYGSWIEQITGFTLE